MKMKFLIDDYTNNQTIIETKVNIVAYLPKAKNKATKARCEISPMSTHNTTHPSNTATASGQANARWYVSC